MLRSTRFSAIRHRRSEGGSGRAGGSADNIDQTCTVDLSSETLNGTWNLRVNDNCANDTGDINSWSVTF